jgi:hypothetical protein
MTTTTSHDEEKSERGHFHGSSPSFNSAQDLNRMKRSTAVTDVIEE